VGLPQHERVIIFDPAVGEALAQILQDFSVSLLNELVLSRPEQLEKVDLSSQDIQLVGRLDFDCYCVAFTLALDFDVDFDYHFHFNNTSIILV
jgi:hypothetical protein